MDRLAPENDERSEWDFLNRVLILVGIVSLAFLAWQLSGVLLLVFGSILVATILRAAARPLAKHTLLSDRAAVIVVALLILGALFAIGLLFGSQITAQLSDITARLPSAINQVEQQFNLGNISEQIREQAKQGSSTVLSNLASYTFTVLGALADFILVIAAGVFIALNPHVYKRGIVKLFPPRQHALVDETLDNTGKGLQLWLIGVLISMSIVGVLSTIAFMIVGLPSAIGLGLIAGLAEFVPLLGPFIGGAAALLVALTQDGTTVIWTLVAVLIIQQLESNMITPIVQRHIVSLPAAVLLFAILAFGVLFGPLGVLFATPLSVVVFTLVNKLYVREALEERTEVPGEK